MKGLGFIAIIQIAVASLQHASGRLETPDGAYARDQCSDPIAIVDSKSTLPDHPAEGQNWWRGKCVTAQFTDWGSNCTGKPCGARHSINIYVAGPRIMPNPGNCSAVAKQYNGGPKPPNWDFSGAGYCGLGDCASLESNCSWDISSTAIFHHGRLACLAHDACVWARCENNALRPNFLIAMGGGIPQMLKHLVTGKAAEELRKGDSACGSVLYDTIGAFMDVENKRIAKFWKRNPDFAWLPSTAKALSI